MNGRLIEPCQFMNHVDYQGRINRGIKNEFAIKEKYI